MAGRAWSLRIYVGEVNFEGGDRDGGEREWVCDSGADYHMFGDSSKRHSIDFFRQANQRKNGCESVENGEAFER